MRQQNSRSPTSAAAQSNGHGPSISRVFAGADNSGDPSPQPRSPNKARNLMPIKGQSSSVSDVQNAEEEEKLLIEDFNEEIDAEFLINVVRPYFKTIFSDLAMRRHSPKTTSDEREFVDKVAFFEYALLPGIINDRFFSLFQKSTNEHVY